MRYLIGYLEVPSIIEISKRGITLPSTLYAFCGVEEVTEIHLFLFYRWVKKKFGHYWNVGVKLRLPRLFPWNN